MSVNVSTLAQYGGQHGVHLLTPSSSCALLHFIHLAAAAVAQFQSRLHSPPTLATARSRLRFMDFLHATSTDPTAAQLHGQPQRPERGSRSRCDGSCSCSCMSDDCPLPLSLSLPLSLHLPPSPPSLLLQSANACVYANSINVLAVCVCVYRHM